MWFSTKKNRLNDLGKKQGTQEEANVNDAYVLLARNFNWTPTQIDDIELGFYYSVCESFERYPPHYMLFPQSVGYEPKGDVKWKDFEKKLKEQEESQEVLGSLMEWFGKANS